MAAWTNQPGARLQAGGKALEYRCWGPPPDAAPTIVMLHEGLGSLGAWRDLPEIISAQTGLGILAYSRAGYGASEAIEPPRPLDYMEREAEQSLGAVMDGVGIEQAILLGHSDGASIAALYAGSVSDMRVRGLILIAPHFFTEPQGLAAIAQVGRDYETSGLRDGLAKYHDDPDAAFAGWHDAWTHPAFETWNIADTIDHWRIPVLAIQGRQDQYGTLAQIEEIAGRIYSPLETLNLDACGHNPLKDQRDKTLAAIAEFCERLERLEREVVCLG